MRLAEAGRLGMASLRLGARPRLSRGNELRLLRDGEAFFPALISAIGEARRWVHLETYIFADDNIGTRVAEALAEAAARGVRTELVLDGFGCGEFGERLRTELQALGVLVRIYRPARWWRLGRRQMRRLHRKIAVIDDEVAFVGGINIIDDFNHPGAERGTVGARFDYAVEVRGPLVAEVALTARRLWWLLAVGRPGGEAASLPPWAGAVPRPRPGGVLAGLLLRDNFRHRRTIEQAYLSAIGGARREVLIACAYFVPGRRFRAALCAAARRGVRVSLLLQGRVDHSTWFHAQQALIGQLLEAGVAIHLYLPSYLHAKVAVVDEDWATVGSSNIDPYSLLLAREANVLVLDVGFAQALAGQMRQVMTEEARRVDASGHARRPWWVRATDWLAYGFVRFATRLLARGDLR